MDTNAVLKGAELTNLIDSALGLMPHDVPVVQLDYFTRRKIARKMSRKLEKIQSFFDQEKGPLAREHGLMFTYNVGFAIASMDNIITQLKAGIRNEDAIDFGVDVFDEVKGG